MDLGEYWLFVGGTNGSILQINLFTQVHKLISCIVIIIPTLMLKGKSCQFVIIVIAVHTRIANSQGLGVLR